MYDYVKRTLVKHINIFLNKNKKKMQEHGGEHYKSVSEDEKQKPFEYRKIYYIMGKNSLL